MKFLIYILFTALLFTACKDRITVNFNIRGGKPLTELTLQIPDSSLLIPLDSTGGARYSLTLDKKHSGYGRLIYGFSQIYLFFYKDFSCSIVYGTPKSEVEFAGKGKSLNEFVNAFNTLPTETYRLNEQEFLKVINQRYSNSLKTMDSIGFPKAFKKTEQIRQKLFDAYVVHNYPNVHASQTRQDPVALSPAYYELLESYLIDDPAVLANGQSQSRLLETVQKSALIGKNNLKDAREELEVKVNFVLAKFSVPSVKSFLIEKLISSYTSRYGVDRLGKLKETFDQAVINPEAKRQLDVLYTQSQKIGPGAVSPEFNYKDINDKTVSLSSLRGKYVYIDIWATWCGPCCKQIPHMAALEHKYKNRNIHFVSISVDKNRKAWQKMVREKDMQGIQLNAGNDQSFSESYMIASIPRFILLDPEGRIINAKMPPPSNPQTSEFLDNLKGL